MKILMSVDLNFFLGLILINLAFFAVGFAVGLTYRFKKKDEKNE